VVLPPSGSMSAIAMLRQLRTNQSPWRTLSTVIQVPVAHWSIVNSIQSGTYGSVVRQGTLSSSSKGVLIPPQQQL